MALKINGKLPRIPLFLAISFVDFLIYYIPRLLLFEYVGAIYASYFICKFTQMLLPLAGAAIIFADGQGALTSILSALKLSAARLIFLLPYYYLSYVNDIYDSIEAVGLSLITSAAVVLTHCAVMLLFLLIMRAVLRKSKGSVSINALRPTNIDNAAVLGIFLAAIAEFAVSLGFEIYDTVVFFIQSSGFYRQSEVTFIIASYVFLLLALLGAHASACLLARSVKRRTAEGVTDI